MQFFFKSISQIINIKCSLQASLDKGNHIFFSLKGGLISEDIFPLVPLPKTGAKPLLLGAIQKLRGQDFDHF